MEVINWPWWRVLSVLVLFSLTGACLQTLYQRITKRHAYEKARRYHEEHYPKRFEEIMASVAHFDPQSEGLIAQIEVAACLVYRDHASANPVAINHLSLIIFSACQEGSIKSYDTNTLFPTAKYSGLVDKWQNSSIFLGEVKPNNVFNTSVNVLEVMEWLASEGYLFCRATMYELQARVGRPQEPTVPQVEAPLIVEKPISTKELNTLLTIIAVLCKEAKLDYKKHSKTAGLILSTAASMGFSIGDTTIENYLKKIPDALGARTK